MMPRDIGFFLADNLDWMKLDSRGATDPNLFFFDLPPNPDLAVALYQYSGRPPLSTFRKPALMRHPRLQVVVRSSSFEEAFNRSVEIRNLLETVKEQDLNSVRYKLIAPQGEPFELGPDTTNRQRVACNYEVTKEGD